MNDELLERLFATDSDQDGRWLLVHGSRGCGKSWWVRRASDIAERAGFAVQRVSGRDLDEARVHDAAGEPTYQEPGYFSYEVTK